MPSQLLPTKTTLLTSPTGVWLSDLLAHGPVGGDPAPLNESGAAQPLHPVADANRPRRAGVQTADRLHQRRVIEGGCESDLGYFLLGLSAEGLVLPQAAAMETGEFERLFGTPTGTDLAALSAAPASAQPTLQPLKACYVAAQEEQRHEPERVRRQISWHQERAQQHDHRHLTDAVDLLVEAQHRLRHEGGRMLRVHRDGFRHRAVAGIVVIDIDDGGGQGGMEITHHLGDGRFLIVAGHQNCNTRDHGASGSER